MKACELTQDHLDWMIKVGHVQGLLKVAINEGNHIRVMAIDPRTKLITGDLLPLDTEVEIEKTLETQVKEDVTKLKHDALSWLRKKIR